MIENEVKQRCPIRDRLAADMKQFLGSGGKVEKLSRGAKSGEPVRFNNKGKGVNYGNEEKV